MIGIDLEGGGSLDGAPQRKHLRMTRRGLESRVKDQRKPKEQWRQSRERAQVQEDGCASHFSTCDYM